MNRRGIGRIRRRLKNRIAGKLAPSFAEATEDVYFPLHRRKDLFFKLPLQGRTTIGQTPRPTTHKEEKMADAKVLKPMNPQDIVKLLVALRRALKARAA